MNPFDYSLCRQTVTVYRKTEGEITRKVAENCHFSYRLRMSTVPYGKSRSKEFLLIIPGNEIPLKTGDRIYYGIGPETVNWETFVPAAVPELFAVCFAQPQFWNGEITHWEAGAERRYQ